MDSIDRKKNYRFHAEWGLMPNPYDRAISRKILITFHPYKYQRLEIMEFMANQLLFDVCAGMSIVAVTLGTRVQTARPTKRTMTD